MGLVPFPTSMETPKGLDEILDGSLFYTVIADTPLPYTLPAVMPECTGRDCLRVKLEVSWLTLTLFSRPSLFLILFNYHKICGYH